MQPAVRFRLRLIEVAFRKAAAARNAGAAEARGDILLFLDDDVHPLAGLLATHLHAHAGAEVVLGYMQTRLPSKPTWWQLGARLWWEERFCSMELPWHRFRYDDLFSGHFSIRASLFRQVGGFDVSLPRLEDYELGIRLKKAGARFAFSRSAAAIHHETTDVRDWVRRQRHDGEAEVQMGRLHPEAREEIFSKRLGAGRPSPLRKRLPRAAGLRFPRVSGAVAWLGCFVLPILEKLHARFLWQTGMGALGDLAYWSGLGAHFRNWAELLRWLGEVPEASGETRTAVRLELSGLSGSWEPGWQAGIVECADVDILLAGRWVATIPADSGDPGHKLTLAYPLQVAFQYISEPDTGKPSLRDLVDSLSAPIALAELDPGRHGALRTTATDHGNSMVHAMDRGEPAGVIQWRGRAARSGGGTVGVIFAHARLKAALAGNAIRSALCAGPGGASPPLGQISVVVCTKDRPEALKRCLSSLSALDPPAAEVLVVDNGSTAGGIEGIAGEYRARYLREERTGLNRARNLGLKSAAKEYIAFIDDDAAASAGWLRGVAAGFRDPGVAAVTGLVLPAELETEPQRQFEIYGGMGKGYLPFTVRGEELGLEKMLWCSEWGVGTNMAFRRSVLLEHGGFSEGLDVGTIARGGGDLEMFWRVVQTGNSLRYEPSALVRHYHRRSHPELKEQVRSNGRAFPFFLVSVMRQGGIPQRAIAWFALRNWFVGWLAKNAVRNLLHGNGAGFRLALAEVRGTIESLLLLLSGSAPALRGRPSDNIR
jgi:GT2 family glycosyltransferase